MIPTPGIKFLLNLSNGSSFVTDGQAERQADDENSEFLLLFNAQSPKMSTLKDMKYVTVIKKCKYVYTQKLYYEILVGTEKIECA
jgi:hypothetical protein